MRGKILIFILLLLASCSGEVSVPGAYQSAQQTFTTPERALSNPEQTAWDILLTMIWPASNSGRGIADANAILGPNQVAVMSTWKNSAEVYLPKGATPNPWNADSPESQEGVDELLTVNSPLQISQISTESQGVSNLLKDSHGNPLYYTVRMNKGTFDAIVANKLYNTEGLLAFYNLSQPLGISLSVPTDSIEIKMAWKKMYPEDDESRFYTRMANIRIPGGEQAKNIKVGLTGMHVMSKILPNWFFMTWEQMDNEKTTNITALGVKPLTIKPEMAAVNQKMQALIAPTGSPWQYYNCMGYEAQAFYDKTGVPGHLGNSQIETQFLDTASCIACHVYAGVGVTPEQKKPFLYTPGAGITAAGNLIGLSGSPNPEDIFLTYKYPNVPDPKSAIYVQTDFIWSIAFEGQPVDPSLQLNSACPSAWTGPFKASTCLKLKDLDQ